MVEKAVKQQIILDYLKKWLPAIIMVFIIFTVPPAAFAVIAAYFIAPVLHSVWVITRLPLTLATLLVMSIILFLIGSFIFIAFHGLVDSIPAIERQVAPFTNNTDFTSKVFTFLEQKVVEYGHALLDYTLTAVRTIFQSIFNLFIFLIAFFFSLRESAKNRFWFLVYFPVFIRSTTKRMLESSGKLIGTFVAVEIRLFLLTFLVLACGFMFIGFNAPIGNAFIISLSDSLPFLGIGIFLLPMAAFYLYTGQLLLGFSLVLLYFVTLITRQIAESYLWASTFQLRAIHAFFITACSVYLFGLPGILLTPFLLFIALKVKQHPYFNV